MTAGPLHEQIASLAQGSTTSTTLVDRALREIDRTQSTLNCFRHVRADRARAEAAAADAERSRDAAAAERKPLLGVPIAIKDDTDIEGLPTHFGCGGEVPPATADAEIVRRLREAGAVIVGKTNTPELGQWPFTDGPAFGHTRSPWNRELTPGGSSGGSAAAVAAGIVAAAVGSDGAGSIRIPAAWSNLVGIKPQRGRVSTAPWPELFNGLTTSGPLARTVGDAALLLSVISGNAEADLHRAEPIDAVAAAARTPGPLRIGLATTVPFSGFPHRVHPVVVAATERMGRVLRELGHQVENTSMPYRFYDGLQFLPRSMAGLHQWVTERPAIVPQDRRTRSNAALGSIAIAPVLGAARRAEAGFGRRVGKLYRRFDVVLAPATATPAPDVHGIDSAGPIATNRIITEHCPMTWPWNVLGWPAVSVPAGFSESVPLGVQLLGDPGSEETLISLAAHLERIEQWHRHVPGRWW
ncbi:amidase [Tsukamurella serpentis]